jgi:hypothetical protein
MGSSQAPERCSDRELIPTMSNDIHVQPLSPAHAANGTVIAVKATVIPPPEPQQVPTPSQIPNPSLRLDPALGLVVIEFRSDTGAITRSFPSQSQLEAYQRWDVTHFGPSPSGRAQRDGGLNDLGGDPQRMTVQPRPAR